MFFPSPESLSLHSLCPTALGRNVRCPELKSVEGMRLLDGRGETARTLQARRRNKNRRSKLARDPTAVSTTPIATHRPCQAGPFLPNERCSNRDSFRRWTRESVGYHSPGTTRLGKYRR